MSNLDFPANRNTWKTCLRSAQVLHFIEGTRTYEIAKTYFGCYDMAKYNGLPLMSYPPSQRDSHHETRIMRDDVLSYGFRDALSSITLAAMEDLGHGQRIANYSVDYKNAAGEWKVLVPVVPANNSLGDRPDGSDPRDSRVGHKRIDVPVVPTSGAHAVDIAEVRFNCIRLVKRKELAADSDVHLASFSLHKRQVPWEEEF